MTPTDFIEWRKRCGLSRIAASRALGMSRSMLFDYERGVARGKGRAISIPRVVELACLALELRPEEKCNERTIIC